MSKNEREKNFGRTHPLVVVFTFVTVLLAFLLLCFAFAYVNRDSIINANEAGLIKIEHSNFGCLTIADHQRLMQLASSTPPSDLPEVLAVEPESTLTVFERGEKVLLLEADDLSGLIKVRRKNETDEFWVSKDAIAK